MEELKEIVLLDYGVGNIGNLYNCFERLGLEVDITSDPAMVLSAGILVLPGVGAFGDAMESLDRNGLIEPLRQRAREGKPLIGICLGMQVMFDDSYEYGVHKGLGILKGSIKKFDEKLRVPHMGWNEVIKAKDSEILDGIDDGDFVYFVHSYKLEEYDESDVLIYSDYGGRFPAAVQRGVIAGLQFHPEKSGPVGQKILKNYIDFAHKSLMK
jgi:imidazole glycerol-phosphate synthase subunit HisH